MAAIAWQSASLRRMLTVSGKLIGRGVLMCSPVLSSFTAGVWSRSPIGVSASLRSALPRAALAPRRFRTL